MSNILTKVRNYTKGTKKPHIHPINQFRTYVLFRTFV